MNTLVEELKDYIKDKPNITFVYGRIDSANLHRYTDEGDLYLFLLSQESNFSIDTFGIDRIEFVVNILYVLKGSIADDWQKKYDTNISRIYDENKKLAQHFKTCSDFQDESWRAVEVINDMDEAMDGLLINATISTHA